VRSAVVYQHNIPAGVLSQLDRSTYEFLYRPGYEGPPISLTMPVRPEPYRFNGFPPFFDGLLPEGFQLEALLRQAKLDRHDYLGQLLQVGSDMVGSVTVFSG
jgi:serine/threonine-protein kinase HipA